MKKERKEKNKMFCLKSEWVNVNSSMADWVVLQISTDAANWKEYYLRMMENEEDWETHIDHSHIVTLYTLCVCVLACRGM